MITLRDHETLALTITTFWDGTACADERLQGAVWLSPVTDGILLTATLPHQSSPRIPDAPVGSRVANLWEYDVVECFLVGEEKYLEVELGAGGHFLVLDFTAPRIRANEYEDFRPKINFESSIDEGRAWLSSIVIPREMIPRGLKAINAFVIVGENYLCYSPLPGPQPDFHQPDRFPKVHIENVIP